MPDKSRLLAQIENAAQSITPVWPLQTFIAANPLAGFEGRDFEDAVRKGQELFSGNGLPTRAMGRQALERGLIDPAVLSGILRNNGEGDLYDTMLNAPLNPLAPEQDEPSRLNLLMIKYLAAFLDEGQSGWVMPGREKGFYSAWRALVPCDSQIADKSRLDELPARAVDALALLVSQIADADREALFERHLAALPGWSGFVKWRAGQRDYSWQQACPVTLVEMLAVRLAMAEMVGDTGLRAAAAETDREGLYWLQAWEETYRRDLIAQLKTEWEKQDPPKRPDAQFVFCIDVRSEVFRRHLEAAGNYQTFGFAGFFGVPVRHRDYGAEIEADSCPVLLDPQYKTVDKPCCGHEAAGERHLHGLQTLEKGYSLGLSVKKDLAASFATVEATGALYGIAMAARTLAPAIFSRFACAVREAVSPSVPVSPTIAKSEGSDIGLSLAERIFHAEAALKIMGLTDNFAPVIVLAGHGSKTVNNPYASGLDCGACGGNHGGPNARIMAAVFNDGAVRAGLKERGLVIPGDTVFIGAEHNTTTDTVEIFNRAEGVPDERIGHIKKDLETARHVAVSERCAAFTTNNRPETRAGDWAEVRPEWGLARNAAFIIGPRAMTKDLNLEGRSFLHSYNWESDEDGKALEIIMTAPLVVAEWINTQYYFSTVDNAVYGSGSKITHNVVGKIGVMQGNASDLMSGLPQQSVMKADGEFYHEPLRLMCVVKAPLARVTQIIAANDILQRLFDNGWVALTVIDPNTGKFMRYGRGRVWDEVADANMHDGTCSTYEQTGPVVRDDVKTRELESV